MQKTTRRGLLRAAAAGGVAAGLGTMIRPDTAASAAGEAAQDPGLAAPDHGKHEAGVSGSLANATVSFGAWPADPTAPLDRYPTNSPIPRNVHQLIPHEATIKAGGSVNFVISGFHLVAVYDDGHEPGDINPNLLEPGTNFIADARRRIYRGLSPAVLAYVPPPGSTTNLGVQDRVEVVQFPHPGRYLVICAFQFHFLDNMFGYVRVLPNGRRDD